MMSFPHSPVLKGKRRLFWKSEIKTGEEDVEIVQGVSGDMIDLVGNVGYPADPNFLLYAHRWMAGEGIVGGGGA